MNKNIFAPDVETKQIIERKANVIDYSVSNMSVIQLILSALGGFIAGFFVLFIFYKIIPLSIAGGIITGIVYSFIAKKQFINKRLFNFRTQFYDLLEAMSVSMRAGNPVLKSLQNAREDLTLIYPENSDIINELDIIIIKFNNAVALSESFSDLAKRTGLEDIASFASIYATIEGKSSRADEIVKETQQIISEKMQIEMEIETLMTAAKSELGIMLILPLVVLAVIGYAGAGFMDSIYTTAVGRLVATGGLIIFIISFIMAQKFSNVKI